MKIFLKQRLIDEFLTNKKQQKIKREVDGTGEESFKRRLKISCWGSRTEEDDFDQIQWDNEEFHMSNYWDLPNNWSFNNFLA